MEPGLRERERFNGIVRPLREEDIPTLRKISQYWLQDFGKIAYDEVDGDMATLRESLRENSTKHMFVVQTKDGKVIGMMGLSEKPKDPMLPFAKTDNPCELIVAYVHPDYQGGQGVGTALITANQNLARSMGKKEILLESGPRHRETGYPFYDKQPDLKRVGVIKDYYGLGADTVVWQKDFQQSRSQFSETITTYDTIAADYEKKSFVLDASQDIPRFTELLPEVGRVLDVGCGYGRELKHFLERGFETYGVDVSSKMLELARRRAPEAKVAKMEATNLAFADATFDGVWCRGVLHHLERDRIPTALSELKRVLRPRGVLFAMCREGEGLVTRKEDLSGGLERTFTQLQKQELESLLRKTGFDLIDSYQYNEVERYGQGREDSNFVVAIGRKLRS